MAILLSSANSTVLIRWADLLNGHYKTETAQTLPELKKLCINKKFDTILLHRMLIDVAAFSALRTTVPAARFFLFSDRPDEEEALLFLKMGIVGYGNTYISSPRLMEALRIVINGGVWLGQRVIQRLITDVSGNTKRDNQENKNELSAELEMAKLTKSQRKIAEMVAHGQSNLEIAADLKITERTVKAHLTSIYEKTKTGNRLNLALLINLGKSPKTQP